MCDTELEHIPSCYFHEDFERTWLSLFRYLGGQTNHDMPHIDVDVDVDGLLLEAMRPGMPGVHVFLSEKDTTYVELVREIRRQCVAHLGL